MNLIYTLRMSCFMFTLRPQLDGFDLSHQHRPATYGPADYVGEFGLVVNAVNNDNSITNKQLLIGPSLSGTWTPE
jgi:hypothetical protein